MIKQIAHVCLTAPDLGAAEKFYTEGLGFAKKFSFIRGGEEFGFYLGVGSDPFIEVFGGDAVPADKPVIKHFCLEVDSVDATATAIRKAGYEVTEKKKGRDSSWQAWVTDPAGVRIEFHEYTPESSQHTGNDCVMD